MTISTSASKISTPVLLFGTGSLPQTVASYLDHASGGKFSVVGFTCDRAYMPDSAAFLGLPVVPFESRPIEEFARKHSSAGALRLSLPVGYRDCNRLRERKYNEAKSWGLEFITYVHPSVQLFPDVSIGENSIIFDHVVLQPGVELGHSCLVWPTAVIGHQTRVGSCSWVSGGTVIAGQCVLGERVFLGANSTVRDGITVADDCIVGMGATITRDTTSGDVYLPGVNKRFFKKSDRVAI